MVPIKVNEVQFVVKKNLSILEACKFIGITIPRFCYHETLSVAGNCRMCLVEIEGIEKPTASCVALVQENISIWTETPFVKKARENVIETLLLNHPLDCPICDQGGECDLQDQTKAFGSDYSRIYFTRRGVEDKNCGPLIKTIMTRCIHCTRCVRFGTEVAGIDFLGTLNRGTGTEIGAYVSKMFNSEISGNVIDLCPVGALTSKPYAFKARPWELRLTETVDTTDSLGTNIYVNFKETDIVRILPKVNKEINGSIISDKTRFHYDSIKINRIKDPFFLVPNKNEYKKLSWDNVFQLIDTQILGDQKIEILINDAIDLETLSLLKKIENTLLDKVQITRLSVYNANYYKDADTIQNLSASQDICVLISSNIKIENAIINARLRFKYLNEIFHVYSLNSTFNTNIPSAFINLNPIRMLSAFEGKVVEISRKVICSENPLLIIGASVNERIKKLPTFVEQIKKLIPQMSILRIGSTSNTNGLDFVNIKTLSYNEITRSDVLICLNLEDNVLVRKIVAATSSTNVKTIWINTHASQLAAKCDVILPVKTDFEQEGSFINLEGRPQKTKKVFDVFYNTRSLQNVIAGIFCINVSASELNPLKFIEEITQHKDKFDKTQRMFIQSISYDSLSTVIISKYPSKFILENFYSSSKMTKNSNTMLKCSQGIRKSSNNFNSIV
jgi:NADH-quinone oxidoreductase subunit G